MCGAGDYDPLKARELVGGEVVVSDPFPNTEVLGVGACTDGTHRNHKSQPIGGCDFAAAPSLRQRNMRLRFDETRIGAGERLGPKVVLLYPGQAVSRQSRIVSTQQRF